MYLHNLDNLENYSDCDEDEWNPPPPDKQNNCNDNKNILHNVEQPPYFPPPVVESKLSINVSKEQCSTTDMVETDKLNVNGFNAITSTTKTTTKAPSNTKDYLRLAQNYKMYAPYQISQLSLTSTSSLPKCILCQLNTCIHVFFPCEHICVCDECIVSNEFAKLRK